jgi:hypothetical protein
MAVSLYADEPVAEQASYRTSRWVYTVVYMYHTILARVHLYYGPAADG